MSVNLATKDDVVELKSELAAVKAEIALLKLVTFTFFPVVIALLVKIAFFPG